MRTARDHQIVAALVQKFRIATADQIARAWWPSSAAAISMASRRLRKLQKLGWIDSTTLFARPLLSLSGPFISWSPGKDAPPFQAISNRLRERWRMPARSVRVFNASRIANQHLVGKDRRAIKNFCQASHDLHVTEVFLHYLHHRPELADKWRGEDDIAGLRHHQVLPDAMLMDDCGEPICAVEFGGSYTAERLRDFHDDCFERQLPYEVW